ncbi:hypothetical protein [Pseudomonas laurentiana]|nr:hypothetical protein [Pseudomonas laurentiana]
MSRFTRPYTLIQPVMQAVRRDWPSDTVLKRRRSVLFAFTFSPPACPN